MDFFMMPLEEKQKYPMAPGTIQGYGQAFVFSEDQKLDWCNKFALGVEPHSTRNPKLCQQSQPSLGGQALTPLCAYNPSYHCKVLSQPLYVMPGQEITGRLHMIAHNA
ncbi:Protein SRG1 [Camellia lanceoleosa]|uniref:Protein SRG1 n=1 Tax=Camellia lanceoleosa TaxID=1840588 RepID=A0ACC0FHK2_9ERIC|nr:Protein SRG1 [Camellia lanceoleosa]